MNNEKFTINSFLKAKQSNKKISMLTAYDYLTAKLLDDAGIDVLLIGDSLGNVVLGYDTTLPVTVDNIVYHSSAVARGAKRAFIVGDMPFLSYHVSVEDSIRNAGRIIQEGQANSVKLEGGREIVDKIKAIVNAQIPVMGHLGLTPQSVNIFGGFKVQGKSEEAAKKILEDALLLQEAGVFALVLECVPEKLAKLITEKLDIPTIGIGAGRYCDGQVLVVQDMMGITEGDKKFLKKYAEVGKVMKDAAAEYIKEINNQTFPDKSNGFKIDEDIIDKLY